MAIIAAHVYIQILLNLTLRVHEVNTSQKDILTLRVHEVNTSQKDIHTSLGANNLTFDNIYNILI